MRSEARGEHSSKFRVFGLISLEFVCSMFYRVIHNNEHMEISLHPSPFIKLGTYLEDYHGLGPGTKPKILGVQLNETPCRILVVLFRILVAL